MVLLKVSRSRNQNCPAITFPKNELTTQKYILETWNRNSSYKYFLVVRIDKQICSFVFWEMLWLNNFVSRFTDLYLSKNIGFLKWFIFTASIGGCGGQKYRHGGFPQQPQFSWRGKLDATHLCCKFDTTISFSSSNTQFYESRIFCLFTFWVHFPDKSFKLIKKYTQKCQYNLLY